MALPVTVYRWDDVGAPQIEETKPKEWLDVLKACLVNGYGTKAAAGWTIAFEDALNHKVVFRNSTSLGSGGFVQFWSGDSGNNVTSVLLYKAACGMSGLDGFIRGGYTEVLKGSSGQDNNKQWMIIATSVSFYFFSLVDNLTIMSKGYYSIFIGDLDSFIPNDTSRFVGGSGANLDRLADSSISPASQSIFYGDVINFKPKLYQADGSDIYVNGSGCSDSYFNVLPVEGTEVEHGVPLVLYDVCVFASAAASVDSDGTVLMGSKLQPFVRGILPGLKKSLFRGYLTTPFPYIKNILGVDHMLVPSLIGYNPNCWINIEAWY
tara:strand:- start:2512 stop:3474 length:963 start_codon:yes stop_codon:yes gene_type:complete